MIGAFFDEQFGISPAATAHAPGRVNLLGEHIDYNGGVVLPMALPVGLQVGFAPRHDHQLRLASDKFDGVIEASISTSRNGHWSDYVIGAVKIAKMVGLIEGGADIAVMSTIPAGAGLSSSAALVVAILKAAREFSGAQFTDVELAVLARRVENDHIGVPCGIMDQMAVAVATNGEAIALDTVSLGYELIQLPVSHQMCVVHSGCERQLADGRYARRNEECAAIKTALETEDICRLSNSKEQEAERLAPPLNRRARHCVTEHKRVLRAVSALRANNLALFGASMNESHVSMRDDFEMSLAPIDALVDDACHFGAIGARLTGGGFGGCIVACVQRENVNGWLDRLLAAHPGARFIC